jgi:polysaccharide biosynthesis PFTS motif protein
MKFIEIVLSPFWPDSKFINQRTVNMGYSKLVRGNHLLTINQLILKILSTDQIRINSEKNLNVIYNVKFLDLQLLNIQQNKKLLCFKGFLTAISVSTARQIPLSYPLSKKWFEDFEKAGIAVNKKVCTLMWNLLNLYKFLLTLYRSLKFLKGALRKNSIHDLTDNGNNVRRIYLPGLMRGQFSVNTSEKGLNLVHWLKSTYSEDQQLHVLHSNSKFKKFKCIGENTTLNYINLNWRWDGGIFDDLSGRLKIFGKLIFTIIVHKERRHLILYLNDTLLSVYLKRKFPIKEILYICFDQSHIPNKPLWTFCSSEINTKCVLFFYAIAAEPSWPNGAIFQNTYWFGSQWLEYWAIDEIQTKSVKSVMFLGNSMVKEVGVPYWIDTNSKFSAKQDSIALFDSEPQRNLLLISNLVALGIYTEHFYESFFEEILRRGQYYKINVLHKGKRNTGKKLEEFYSDIINSNRSKYCEVYSIVDYGVSPHRLLRECIGSISQPISTAAVISKSLHLKTAFFDPTRSITKSDLELRGIDLLNSQIDLDHWFEALKHRRGH